MSRSLDANFILIKLYKVGQDFIDSQWKKIHIVSHTRWVRMYFPIPGEVMWIYKKYSVSKCDYNYLIRHFLAVGVEWLLTHPVTYKMYLFDNQNQNPGGSTDPVPEIYLFIDTAEANRPSGIQFWSAEVTKEQGLLTHPVVGPRNLLTHPVDGPKKKDISVQLIKLLIAKSRF